MIKTNYSRAFKVFAKHYNGVPLEIFIKPYEALISTLLSSRTNDDTTLVVCNKLFKKAPNIRSLDKLDESEIRNLIYPVGFYNTKAKNLKKLATQIITNFGGEIPSDKEDLIKLRGVGIKTANLVLVRAFKKPAISVDTHVHRICNMLGWVKTKTPEQTERELVSILPKKYWLDINRYFVSVGRQYRSKKQLREFLEKNKLI